MKKDIMNNRRLSDEQKRYAIDRLDDQIAITSATTIMRWVGTTASLAAGIVLGPGAALAFEVGLALFDMGLDYVQDYCNWSMNDMMYRLFTFGWAIDPSGYVYDAETGKRIPGVTVTIHWIPVEEADDDYWKDKPADDVCGEIWTAEEYSQLNPIVSDLDGNYAWDVPEGWWRVQYEMNGYETTWSEWLAVPPPHTDVNIAMEPLEIKTIIGDVNVDGDVDATDRMILARYLAGWEGYEEKIKSKEAADIDGNGAVEAKDRVILARYLAGWDGYDQYFK